MSTRDPQDAVSLLTSSKRWPLELPLSPRECEICRLVASGLTNKEIGGVLEISEWTVSTHLRRVFGKLQVHSKVAMVAQILDIVAAAERRRALASERRTRDVNPKVQRLSHADAV